MKLKDKVAIVTGAGVGMGKAVAVRYVKEGAKVVIAELNKTTSNETLSEIKNKGGEAIFIQTNVADEEQVKALVNKTIETYGRIDILYNNVAIIDAGDNRVHETSSEVFIRSANINFFSAFYCAKHVITEMLKTGGGSIIIVGSPTAVIGCAPGIAAYSSTKAGVHSLARVIAAGYGKEGIRANIIIPGTMDTPMNAVTLSDKANIKKYEDHAMLGRLGKADDVAGLAVFLASDDSSYCTGSEFYADGGMTMK